MLSKKCLCCISKCFQHACYLKMLPFDWEPKASKLTVISDYRVLIPFFIFFYNILTLMYLFTAYFMLRKSMSVSIQSFYIFWATGYFLGTVNKYINLTQKYEIATFVTHFFSHQRFNPGNKIQIYFIEINRISPSQI